MVRISFKLTVNWYMFCFNRRFDKDLHKEVAIKVIDLEES